MALRMAKMAWPTPPDLAAEELLRAIHARYRALQRLPVTERPGPEGGGVWRQAGPRYTALIAEIRGLADQYVAQTEDDGATRTGEVDVDPSPQHAAEA